MLKTSFEQWGWTYVRDVSDPHCLLLVQSRVSQLGYDLLLFINYIYLDYLVDANYARMPLLRAP